MLTPDPAGLHGRIIAEARAYSALRVEADTSGRPGWVRVVRKCSGETVTSAHRDVIAAYFDPLDDPAGLMTKPASD